MGTQYMFVIIYGPVDIWFISLAPRENYTNLNIGPCLGAIRHKVTTWVNDDSGLCHHPRDAVS